LGFNGNLYQESGATSVLSTKGDIVRYNTERERYGIGSAGQVLQVASSLPTWSTINLADSVLTTQGDVLYEGASALARLGQSTDNFTLATKGSGQNPAWQASATSVLTTTGDLLYASGANTLARLAGGTSGDVLTANGAGVAPSYQTAGGGGAWSVIGNYIATGAEKTTTFSSLAVDFDDYSEVVVSVDLSLTAGEDIDMQINGVTSSSYYTDGWQVQDNSDSIIDRDGVSAVLIAPASLVQTNEITCINHIQLTNTIGDKFPNIATVARGEGLNGGVYMVASSLRSSETDIDAITIKANENWNIGSRMTVYKVSRT